MESYNYEDLAHESDYLTNKWPVHANSQDDEDDRDTEEEEETNTDWGDVDPAGGPEPTSPGSAV